MIILTWASLRGATIHDVALSEPHAGIGAEATIFPVLSCSVGYKDILYPLPNIRQPGTASLNYCLNKQSSYANADNLSHVLQYATYRRPALFKNMH